MAKQGQKLDATGKVAIVVALLLMGGLAYLLFRKKPKPPIEEEEEAVIKEAYDNLLFATNRATILSSSFPSLDELGEFLINNPEKQLSIIGHTDNVGSETYNQELSQQRADAVKTYLTTNNGVSINSVLQSIGKGESEPIDTNNTAEGRRKNRRVEFVLTDVKTT